MNKDHTLEQAYAQIERIQGVGYAYAAHIMTGISGKGRGEENARALAYFINRTKPRSITNFSLFLHRRAPLWKDVEAGRFVPADEVENLREERLLLSLLEVDGLEYDGFHDIIEFRVRGKFPRDRERMLEKLDKAIRERENLPPVFAVVE